jgi:ABC-type multidrug transport system ATPase subunit
VLSRPRLLLLDEPFTGLDLFARYRVREVLRDLRDQRHVTILFTTRDRMEAENLADRFAVLADGRLAAIETPVVSAYPIWPAPLECCTRVPDKMSV